MVEDWERMLAPYYQAVEELKVKLKGIRREYLEVGQHSPIEFVTGRVKTPDSIREKVQARKLDASRLEEEVQDIGGLRVMCQFVEDIYLVVQLLRERQDFDIVIERDYILNKKDSGYRSYHLVIDYPVERVTGAHHILLEIQIRTLAMNFWATIEHSLNYKYDGDYPQSLHKRLERAAEAAFRLDEEMSQIREEIQIAQDYFKTNKG
ncbi:GTP pyrophosphokinase [Aerococcus kribbianus]|uniref:GTP pyrophosphokinase family protein n=1 Tax=Aerococcus kribbianus TaxID=2999064 RepID=A0A9X3JGX4_9LACT|nr:MULTISPECIES: GTP pyrophosphokinase family protein [unclassified Aerococcus]MCZ0717741.1 GTP pyrophosphokinase family protein [Aerococcus sp. YH-aer221]MCZ0726029.1 GTP pyrophosphokinase family protein [Aerococcus sp. YH-aer222]